MEKAKKQNKEKNSGKKMTRKEAIKKAGVTALAATSLILLDTKAKACASGYSGGDHEGGEQHQYKKRRRGHDD